MIMHAEFFDGNIINATDEVGKSLYEYIAFEYDKKSSEVEQDEPMQAIRVLEDDFYPILYKKLEELGYYHNSTDTGFTYNIPSHKMVGEYESSRDDGDPNFEKYRIKKYKITIMSNN